MTVRAERAERGVRVIAVDVLRGLTVAAMLLVNDPGDPAHVFAPLRHSVWHGWTPTDLVFPFFLFLVGITTHLSLARRAADDPAATRRAILRRAAVIFGVGLLLNAYPFFEKGAIAGPAWLPPALGHVVARFADLRLMGVLQRIGLVYLATAAISWRAPTRRVVGALVALLVGYWVVMTLLPVPGESAIGTALLDQPGHTMAAWVDRVTLDWTRWGLGWHLWDRAVPYDPEGLLSTLPAIATALCGVLTGRWLGTPRPIAERLAAVSAAGALAMMLGAMWGWTFPINKPIWTSSYVLFTAGTACLALGTIGWLVDVQRWTRWTAPVLVFGTNPLAAYIGGEFLASVLRSSIKLKLDGHRVGVDLAVTRTFERLGADPYVASLLWAVLYVLLWYAILRPWYRRGMLLRV